MKRAAASSGTGAVVGIVCVVVAGKFGVFVIGRGAAANAKRKSISISGDFI